MTSPNPIVVIDPGHGGAERIGGSSANNTATATGQLEKDLALDIARRVRTKLADVNVILTRDEDRNLALADRAALAQGAGAAAFVSLHLNASADPAEDCTEIYIARRANEASERLAASLHRNVAHASGTNSGGVFHADLGVLVPDRHATGTAACLAELACLSNPAQAARLADPDYRDSLAAAIATSVRDALARTDSPVAPATAAAQGDPLQDAVDQLVDIVRRRAAANAAQPRSVDPASRFVDVLRRRYLAAYLAAPSAAAAEQAIALISAQNQTGSVAAPCGVPDRWEQGTPEWNHAPIPEAIRNIPGLGWLPADVGAATQILTVDNRRELSHLDVPFLLGRHVFDTHDCNAYQPGAVDPDLAGENSINESQLMHWATGVRYTNLGRDRLRELFLAYELWHLELWDVFGHDPINDLIAEDAGRHLAEQLRAVRVTDTNLASILDEGFRQARAWVGALLRLRRAELETQIAADAPKSALIWWDHSQAVPPTSPDHPYPLPSLRQQLAAGNDVSTVAHSHLADRYIEVYTLLEEAGVWESTNGTVPTTWVQRNLADHTLDLVFMTVARPGGRPTLGTSTAFLGYERRRPRGLAVERPRARTTSITAPVLPPPALSAWQRLLSFRPPTGVQAAVAARGVGWHVHRIEDASGDLNLDYYPVTVSEMPILGGIRVTPAQLLEHIRLNINTVVDTNICNFEPYDTTDVGPWGSGSPTGSVVHIDMRMWNEYANLDDGSVVCAESTPDHWIFSTIWTTGDLAHPVSGNRQFGYEANDDGTFTFYTRGADRPTSIVDSLGDFVVFGAANNLWLTLQQGIARLVNDNGGAASIGVAHSERYSWPDALANYGSASVPWI